jgi:cold shock CspA family protein
MASIVMKGATEAIFTREIEGLRPGDDVTFTLTNKGDGPEAADVHIQLR